MHDILFNLLGDLLFLMVYKARTHDVEIFPKQTFSIYQRFHKFLDDLVFHIHELEHKFRNIHLLPFLFLVYYVPFVLIQ